MLFMIIETFKHADAAAIGKRFTKNGRMLPDGVTYHASWIDRARMRCFQIMEASDVALVNQWANRWADLIDFEIIPVQSSADFWADIPRG
jgi:hypothetical protein